MIRKILILVSQIFLLLIDLQLVLSLFLHITLKGIEQYSLLIIFILSFSFTFLTSSITKFLNIFLGRKKQIDLSDDINPSNGDLLLESYKELYTFIEKEFPNKIETDNKPQATSYSSIVNTSGKLLIKTIFKRLGKFLARSFRFIKVRYNNLLRADNLLVSFTTKFLSISLLCYIYFKTTIYLEWNNFSPSDFKDYFLTVLSISGGIELSDRFFRKNTQKRKLGRTHLRKNKKGLVKTNPLM